MIIISLPASWLTPAISIEDMAEIIQSSGTMTELWAANDSAEFNYWYAFTGNPGEQYKISIDAWAAVTNVFERFHELFVTEESAATVDNAAIAAAVRVELTVELARLDAAVTTRMATFTYTAPDNAWIAAVKTQTDKLTFTWSNLHSVAKLVEDKTWYSLTPAERTAIAVAVEQAILNDWDGQAILNAIVWAIGNQNIDQIALVAAIRADIERNGGMLDAVPTLSEIEASSILAKESSVSAIPTNPLLTNDLRLNNLDAPVSTAWGGLTTEQEQKIDDIKTKTDNLPASPASTDDVNVSVTVDGGFSAADRTTLETIPTLAEIEAWAKMTSIESKLILLERMEKATVRISWTQLIMEDWVWEIQRWNLKDSNGQPTSSVPYIREKI